MKKYLTIMLLFVPLVLCAYVSERTINVTVGSSFTISPWSERGSDYSSFTCQSTYVTASDASAFSINITSKTSTTYTSYSGIQHGYYATYSVEALKTGNYILYGGSQCIRSVAGGWTTGNPVIKYNVIVSNPVLVNTIVLNTAEAEITIGEKIQLETTIIPNDATNKSVTWSTTNEAVAIVDNNGMVSGVGVGTCQIKVTANDGSGRTSSCTVKVNPIEICNITLNKKMSELIVGENLQLETSVLPNNATDKRVTWKSSNNSIATVDDNGLVTAVAYGQCNIIVSTVDGSNLKDTCQIIVLDNYLSIDNTVGVPGGTSLYPILLNNVSDITGMQFEIQLPDGVSVAQGNSDNLLASLSDRAND